MDIKLLLSIYECLVHIGCSAYDIGTDVGNAYGYMTGNNIAKEICNLTTIDKDDHGHNNVNSNEANCYGTEKFKTVEKLQREWGMFIILLIFAPGIFWICRPKSKTGMRGRRRRIMGLFFPLYALGYGFYAIFNPSNKKVKKRLLLICACEAFFESYPQIIVTIYTLSYKDTSITTIQSLCLAGSILSVAYAILCFDILGCDVELKTLKDYIIYLLKVLPLYGFGTLFRVLSLSLTIIYLRWLAIIPTIILLGEMIIIVGVCIQWDFDIIYHMALTNLNVANIGMIGIKQMHEEPDDEKQKNAKKEEEDGKSYDVSRDRNMAKKCQRFLTVSQYITYIHHCTVLSVILYGIRSVENITWFGSSSTIDQLEDMFDPDHKWHHVRSVYVIFCSVFMIGTLDVLVTSCMSRHVKFGQTRCRKSMRLSQV